MTRTRSARKVSAEGGRAAAEDECEEGAQRLSDTAVKRTFEPFATRGAAPVPWDGLFARLDADTDLDGAHDRDTLPLVAEPQRVRTDLDRLGRR